MGRKGDTCGCGLKGDLAHCGDGRSMGGVLQRKESCYKGVCGCAFGSFSEFCFLNLLSQGLM